MARTSAKAKKSKQEVNKKKEESKQNENKSDNEGAGDSTDKENDSINYDVEKITHTRIFKGKRQYLVRWKGYTEDSDTWENESALQSCKDVLEAFKKEHLIDVNSDDEVAEEEEVEEKGKEKAKKVAKTGKKNTKPSGRSSQLKTETENSESELEPEEVKKEVKGKLKGNSINEEESDIDSEGNSKNKKTKGKKRNAAKESGSSKVKKAKKVESDDESVTDGKNYEVEKILEVHTRRDGSHEFLIRWKGYKPSDDTWEPEEHLDCQELIDKFMEKVDKAKEITKKELRGNRTQKQRFVPLNNMSGRVSKRNSGLRPCYQESYED